MNKLPGLMLILSLSAWLYAPAVCAQEDQFTAGTGDQMHGTAPTMQQATPGQSIDVGSFIAPTGTYELSHASVNRAALPNGASTFRVYDTNSGFTDGPVYPNAGGPGAIASVNDTNTSNWDSVDGDMTGGSNFNSSFSTGNTSIPFAGGNINTGAWGALGQSAGGQYVPPDMWGSDTALTGGTSSIGTPLFNGVVSGISGQ